MHTIPPAIEARRLTKTYAGGVEAVRGLDFDVEPGEMFGLLGPNGAGKSTVVVSMPTTVDFPAPFGPSSPNTSPGATSKSMPRTASTPPAYVLVRFLTSIAVVDPCMPNRTPSATHM